MCQTDYALGHIQQDTLVGLHGLIRSRIFWYFKSVIMTITSM